MDARVKPGHDGSRGGAVGMILARFPMAVRGSLPTALATGLALAMPVPAAAEPDFYSGCSICHCGS